VAGGVCTRLEFFRATPSHAERKNFKTGKISPLDFSLFPAAVFLFPKSHLFFGRQLIFGKQCLSIGS
jgi:hypothetical protein